MKCGKDVVVVTGLWVVMSSAGEAEGGESWALGVIACVPTFRG